MKSWPLLIVDATAGYRLMWKGKDTRYTVFLDKRPECRPDIVCDDRNLPLRPHIADVIIEDPPHLIEDHCYTKRLASKYPYLHYSNNFEAKIADMYRRYGYWPTFTHWVNYLHHTNREFHTLLKPTGHLIMKIAQQNGHKRPNISHIQNQRTNFQVTHDIWRASNTHVSGTLVHWLTLKPNN